MKEVIGICRFVPFDLNLKNYNVQELGMAKAFCNKGYDVDLIVFKSTKQSKYVLYQNENTRVMCIELPRIRVFRWGVNFSLLNADYWRSYKFIICFEYMEIMSYLISIITKKVILYSGPYYNLFTIKPFSAIYDKLVISNYNKLLLGNFTKSILAQHYLEKKGLRNVKTLGVGLDFERFNKGTGMQPSTKK